MDEMIYHDGLDLQAAELEAVALRLSWGMRRRLQQHLEVFNLTLPQYIAMNRLHRGEGGCSMSELAEASHQLSPTMTGIIDRLVERGLVKRERAAHDRRALCVELTQEGRELMVKIDHQKRIWALTFLQAVSPEERLMINTVLKRFLEVIEDLPIATGEIMVGD